MKAPRFDPSRLDVTAFARVQGELSGITDVTHFTRLATSLVAPADGAPAPVRWSAGGLWSERAGRRPELRLSLDARATVWLECQRCLQPMASPLVVNGRFLFVDGEDEAARLDDESEEDVLALPRALDVLDLLEDELILALPIVPCHDVCPQPIAFSAEAGTDFDAAGGEYGGHPFAVLARLKPGKPES
ncbi:MAG TPA: DUF177 domain-containing protein [Rubrivivax sp.]